MIDAALGGQAEPETVRAEQGGYAPLPGLALLVAAVVLPAATALVAILILLGVVS